MFKFLPNLITEDDIRNWKIEAIRQVLTPIKHNWPKIHAELIAACDKNYEPGRLGDVLVAQFGQLFEEVKSPEQKRRDQINDLLREARKEADELKHHLSEISKENKDVNIKIEKLEKSLQETAGHISAQNELITSLYQQIQNLTGGEIE